MEKILLNYFNERPSAYLTVLDNKYRRHYIGVTLNYIVYDLLKAKYRKSDVAKCLLTFHKESKIRSLHCPNVKNYVFESPHSKHANFDIDTGEERGTYTQGHNLHEYLKQFIKNE